MLKDYEGLPIKIDAMPEVVTVYGQVVDRDTKKIFMLIVPEGDELPAMYVWADYNKPLHKALAEGKRKGKGNPFQLKAKGGEGGEGEGKGDKEGEGKGKGEEGENGKGRSISLESATWGVFDLPPPIMAPKE